MVLVEDDSSFSAVTLSRERQNGEDGQAGGEGNQAELDRGYGIFTTFEIEPGARSRRVSCLRGGQRSAGGERGEVRG